MAQQIINTGANANDGTGEPLREAFTAVNDNFTEIYTAGPVGTNVQIVGNAITTTQPNQGLTLRPNGIGKVQANAAVVPGTNLVYDLGSPTQQWDSVYAGYFFGNGAGLTGVVGGNASNSFSTIDANGASIVATSPTSLLTLTPGNNINITGTPGTDTVTFGVASAPNFSGTVTAGNVAAGGTVSAAGNIIGANLRTGGSVSASGNIVGNNVVFTGNLVGNISTTGNVIAGNLISTQAIIAATNITAAANISGNYVLGNGAFLTGLANVGGNYSNANVAAFLPTFTGNVSANYFLGNGSQLACIAGANVVGIVSRANIANVAYSVSAANIVGNVANATYAEYAKLAYNAWGNGVVGSVTMDNTANVAYSVAGANVTGTVANATYAVSAGSASTANTANRANIANIANIANVAYSVAGANVSGTVANATYAEYANLAYNVYGNGVIGSVSSANTANIASVAYSVAGANVSGTVANATYAVTAGSANTANRANIANVAYSVSAANIVGNVANATYAEYANLAYNLAGGANITFGTVSATGNIITDQYFQGNGAFITGIVASAGSAIENGQSNVRIGGPDANVTVSVDGVSNVTVFNTSGITVKNNISAVGNVTANAFIGSGAALTDVMADRGLAPNNWNTMTQMGVYTVNRVSWSGTVGTPLDSQVYVGLVEVKNSTNTALEQVYYPGTLEPGNAKIQWNRTYWAGTWSAWLKIVNDDQVVVGGTF